MDRYSGTERAWSDIQLQDAVAAAANWRDVMRALGLRADSAGAVRILKRHVVRLGLDTSHFRGKRSWSDTQLRTPEGIRRVQVKSTTCYSKDGWTVPVSRRPYSIGNRERRVPYDPELIDWFLILDGDLNIYLIPSRVLAGQIAILLRTYTEYIVGNAGGLMMPPPRAA